VGNKLATVPHKWKADIKNVNSFFNVINSLEILHSYKKYMKLRVLKCT